MKDSSIITSRMDTEGSNSTMATSSKASSSTVNFTDKECSDRIPIPTKAILGMGNTMGKESIPGVLEIITKEDINLAKRADSVSIKMLTDRVTKETG